MKVLTGGAAGRAALVLVLSAPPVPPAALADTPQAKPQAAAPADAESRVEDEVARREIASRPQAEHRFLDPLAGSWTVDISWRRAGQASTHMTGTSENRWILGGRFLLCEAAVGEGSSRVVATTIYGYDNREATFFAIVLNNLGTYYRQRRGTYDPANRSFILSGRERDEVTGSALGYRELLKIEGPDRYVLTVFVDVPGRAPQRVIEATYARR
jgi:hypothetical protein